MFLIRRVQLSPALALYDAIQSLFFVDHLPGVHRDETCSSVPDRENYHLGAGSTLTLIVAVERAVGIGVSERVGQPCCLPSKAAMYITGAFV